MPQPTLSPEHLAPMQLALRASVAAGLATWVAQALSLAYPLYAMISAVIVIDPDPKATRQLSWRRFIATIIGASIGALTSPWLQQRPIAIALAILLTMTLCHFLKLDGSARVSGYICGIVLLDFADEPWVYEYHRSVETTLGILAALAVSFVPRLYVAQEGAQR
jgi:uncharacterized membrane protein YgaE (UPF0421/DUF939 family)